MAELLSPAGGWDSLVAAVQSGADAVYMGFGAYNARRSAKNFTEEEFAQAVRYCHLRGVRVYVTINTLLTDRELEKAADMLLTVSRSGAAGSAGRSSKGTVRLRRWQRRRASLAVILSSHWGSFSFSRSWGYRS